MRKQRGPMSDSQKRQISERMKRFRAENPKPKRSPQATGAGVYVLREVGTNYVKIGTTVRFQSRYVSMVRPDNPRPLRFMGWLSRDPNDERIFHAAYAHCAGALGGGVEWFLLTNEQIAALESTLLR